MTLSRTPPQEGHPSPWGPVHHAEDIADGIVSVHTASHGGLWLSPARLDLMDPSERSTDGWYEEDCEAAFPLRRFRDEVLHACPPDRLDPYIDTMMTYSGGSFSKVAMNRNA